AYKFWQLEAASRCGLSIPETVVTNDPATVRNFYERFNGQVIYKLIGAYSSSAIPPFEFPQSIPTLPLRAEDLPHLDQVRLAPHYFQRRIEKSFEVRTTVIGKKLFSALIDSQAGAGKVDWRLDYSVPMEPYDLPADTAAACLQLMQYLSLNYGALDLCVTP